MCSNIFLCYNEEDFDLENLLVDKCSKFGKDPVKIQCAREDTLHVIPQFLSITDTWHTLAHEQLFYNLFIDMHCIGQTKF